MPAEADRTVLHATQDSLVQLYNAFAYSIRRHPYSTAIGLVYVIFFWPFIIATGFSILITGLLISVGSLIPWIAFIPSIFSALNNLFADWLDEKYQSYTAEPNSQPRMEIQQQPLVPENTRVSILSERYTPPSSSKSSDADDDSEVEPQKPISTRSRIFDRIFRPTVKSYSAPGHQNVTESMVSVGERIPQTQNDMQSSPNAHEISPRSNLSSIGSSFNQLSMSPKTRLSSNQELILQAAALSKLMNSNEMDVSDLSYESSDVTKE